MSFHSGRVSYCRFHVNPAGHDLPATVDDTLLALLKEHAFQETDIGAPDETEIGWTTGEHILDTQFTYEKNGFGSPGQGLALFALRIDTHKVPSEIKQAYRKMNEQAAAEGNPSGFASKVQKREAQDVAGRQIHEDLAAGKFRKSKLVPVLWDLANHSVYCAATTNAAAENLARLFRQTFGGELELLSSGTVAGQFMRAHGRTRDWEDLHPTPFTDAPPEAHARDEDDFDGPADPALPNVPWRAQAVDLKDFLGNEFLLWLWHRAETAEGIVPARYPDGRETEAFITLDKTLDMECAWGVRGKQSLRGDGPTRFTEAAEALATGKWPRKAGLLLSDGELQWELTLQADRFHVSGAALPDVADAQSPRELIEGRLHLTLALNQTLDAMYHAFLHDRTAGAWSNTRQQLRQWIRDRRPANARQPAAEPVAAT